MDIAETLSQVSLPWWLGSVFKDKTEDRRHWITKGLGAGGTFGAVMWHLHMCDVNRASPYSWAIAQTYQQVGDTLIPTFREVLTQVLGFEEGTDFSILSGGRPLIKLHYSGQEIQLRSATRAANMTSVSVSHITGSEIALWPELAYHRSSDRMRCPKAVCRQYLGESVPEGFNWFQALADFPQSIDAERNFARYIVPTWHNKHLPRTYVKGLRARYAYDSGKIKAYVEGLFVNFNRGSAYWEFFDSRNVKDNLQASEILPIIIMWDLGVSPLAWTAAQAQPDIVERARERRIQYRVVAEGSGNARGLRDACAEFIAVFDPAIYRDTPIEIDGGHDGYFGNYLIDGSAYNEIATILSKEYKRVTVHASRVAAEVRDRLENTNALFAYEKLVIDSRCTNTIRSFSTSALKPNTWILDKRPNKDPTHFADSVSQSLFWRTRHDVHEGKRNKIHGVTMQW